VRIRQVRSCQVGIGQVRPVQVGTAQVRATEVGALQEALTEILTPVVKASQIGLAEIGKGAGQAAVAKAPTGRESLGCPGDASGLHAIQVGGP